MVEISIEKLLNYLLTYFIETAYKKFRSFFDAHKPKDYKIVTQDN